MKIETISEMDRGLAYAEACFETFRVINGEIFGWPAHAARLQHGLAAFALAVSDAQLEQMHTACLQAVTGSDAVVRLTISGGEAPWGLFTAATSVAARIQVLAYHAQSAPLALTVLEWPSPPADRIAKFTADYAATLRILRGERHALLVHEQQLLSAAAANVMICRRGEWSTPPAGAGVLPGVIRHSLLAAGIVREQPCPVAWLDDCDALALTASSFFVRPVSTISHMQHARALHDRSHVLKQCLAGLPGVPKDLLDA